ncbi:nuclear cap-binding protein [Plasmodium ovale wallikeri]|uniref:Nuclear cap-binding protein n=1 Tax=Plasmodium ovale wallikeri TaxID=864142 RepID=A0A1A8YLA4_PLAOA|nr:nuclear cap-binding protein [Plasmodium ovale wallikeri]
MHACISLRTEVQPAFNQSQARMSHLYEEVYKKRKYYDRALCNDYEDWLDKIQLSKTVYIGNLSIYTTEQQIYEVTIRIGTATRARVHMPARLHLRISARLHVCTSARLHHMCKAGDVDDVIMGLHRTEKTPCGFCFVVYKKKEGYTQAVNLLNNSLLDGRIIRVDEDLGVIGKRKYGRGKTGVQKRDERNKYFDEDRPKVLDNLVDKNLILKKRKYNDGSYGTTNPGSHNGMHTGLYGGHYVGSHSGVYTGLYSATRGGHYDRNVRQRTFTSNNVYSADSANNKPALLKPTVTLYPNVQHMMAYNRQKNRGNKLPNFHAKRERKTNT